jgi:hypothetical protein
LRENGIQGQLLNWISNYLSNRQQKVMLRTSESAAKPITAGVPQGSVLGPLMFLIYVNDISNSLLSLTRLFADDSSLYCSASSLEDIEGILNHDLNLISIWAKTWLVDFNPNKTEAMLFSFNNNDVKPKLKFEDTYINFVENHKHLGVTISTNGQWGKHIDNVLSSASKTIGLMKKMKFVFSRRALNQIYISYVRPILEYSCIVWDGCSINYAEKLEKIQNEAARIVTGLTKSVSLENLYRECGWSSLADRRKNQKLHFMYKVNNETAPSYILDLMPPLVAEMSRYPLRNNENIATPYARTVVSHKSCIPSSITLWNNLSVETRNADSYYQFKAKLQNSIQLPRVPSYYNYGKRPLQIFHARLRNGCSNLNNDLYNNHIQLERFCDCSGDIENSEHFFFRCQFYINQRLDLFNETHNFHPLNTNTLLFGSHNLSDEDNLTIFSAVHKFIQNTKRFN